jgi:transposase
MLFAYLGHDRNPATRSSAPPTSTLLRHAYDRRIFLSQRNVHAWSSRLISACHFSASTQDEPRATSGRQLPNQPRVSRRKGGPISSHKTAALQKRILGVAYEVLKEKDRWEIQVLRRSGHSIRHIAAITGHNKRTISKVLAAAASEATLNGGASGDQSVKQKRSGRRSALEPFRGFLLSGVMHGARTPKLLLDLRNLGFSGSLRSLQRFLRSSRNGTITTPQSMRDLMHLGTEMGKASDHEPGCQEGDWMHLVLQGVKTGSQVKEEVGDSLTGDEVETLLKYVKTKSLKLRNRALAVLAHGKGISPVRIASFLCIRPSTAMRYISSFKKGGILHVLDLSRNGIKKAADPKYSTPVFTTLHTPPSLFGFNRTTWRMDDLYAVLAKQGVRISRSNIRKIIRAAGYRFRKAKKVLTSTDPEYREKLKNITHILAHLAQDEKFFSIDEFGPFSVKIVGGTALARPDELRSVPQIQTSKGSLIATAALELSTNQITHFFSEKKDTDEMIRMLELLVSQYRNQSRIFFSWDAASWHGSKKFFRRVDEINNDTYRAEQGTPVVEMAPLPSCAQFLNVIESVFSGMARAIIHNSDYASVEDAKAAIDRYFSERNDHFQKHPRRAGKKIWGEERVEPEFNESNNCKDPRW